MSKSVFCIATTQGQAERIVARLQSQGFADSEISVLLPDSSGTGDFGHVKSTKASEGIPFARAMVPILRNSESEAGWRDLISPPVR